jgi:SET domain
MMSAELDALPPKLRKLICALFVPTDGDMWLPNCGTNLVYLNAYLNHSTTPNLRTRDGYHFVSLRKICEGEELTVDYRTYGRTVCLLHRRARYAKAKISHGNMHH